MAARLVKCAARVSHKWDDQVFSLHGFTAGVGIVLAEGEVALVAWQLRSRLVQLNLSGKARPPAYFISRGRSVPLGMSPKCCGYSRSGSGRNAMRG